MASASQSYPSRPYSSTLHGKLTDRSGGPGNVGGGVGTGAARGIVGASNQGGPSGMIGNTNMPNITDEQREEVNEAVSRMLFLDRAGILFSRTQLTDCVEVNSSHYSIWTKTKG